MARNPPFSCTVSGSKRPQSCIYATDANPCTRVKHQNRPPKPLQTASDGTSTAPGNCLLQCSCPGPYDDSHRDQIRGTSPYAKPLDPLGLRRSRIACSHVAACHIHSVFSYTHVRDATCPPAPASAHWHDAANAQGFHFLCWRTCMITLPPARRYFAAPNSTPRCIGPQGTLAMPLVMSPTPTSFRAPVGEANPPSNRLPDLTDCSLPFSSDAGLAPSLILADSPNFPFGNWLRFLRNQPLHRIARNTGPDFPLFQPVSGSKRPPISLLGTEANPCTRV